MLRYSARILCVTVLILQGSSFARADNLGAGIAAFKRGDYLRAARQLGSPTLRRDSRAQAVLGYMYAYGLGVPQSYPVAVDLLSRAAESGDPDAQHFLGLMYDKGLGVLQNDILAYKWLNLAAAGAPKREREYYLRLRNAVASKMTAQQIAEGQWLALNWIPTR